jgi:hypothetical protein
MLLLAQAEERKDDHDHDDQPDQINQAIHLQLHPVVLQRQTTKPRVAKNVPESGSRLMAAASAAVGRARAKTAKNVRAPRSGA